MTIVSPAFVLAIVATASLPLAQAQTAETDAPVIVDNNIYVMDALRIKAVIGHIKAKVVFTTPEKNDPKGERQTVVALGVLSVKSGSAAAKLIKKGMEITEIHGRRLRGLTRAQYYEVMNEPYTSDAYVFKVRDAVVLTEVRDCPIPHVYVPRYYTPEMIDREYPEKEIRIAVKEQKKSQPAGAIAR